MYSLKFYFVLIQFGFVFLSYYFFLFFSMIVKCYSIAYKDSLQEYNVILLYSMAWIILCLIYDYIFYFNASSSHFIFYFSPEKGDYSLSLSLYIYIYIYIIYSFLQLYFRLMNHYIFFIILFWINMIW